MKSTIWKRVDDPSRLKKLTKDRLIYEFISMYREKQMMQLDFDKQMRKMYTRISILAISYMIAVIVGLNYGN